MSNHAFAPRRWLFGSPALLAIGAALPGIALAQNDSGDAAIGRSSAVEQTQSRQTDTLESEDEIIVTGRAVPGAVIGDIPPENQLNRADIDAYGVSTVSELLDEISAQTQSGQGRGDDGPVVLVNGKRISGVNEVKDLPTESILRVDILPEEVALKYGYDAQRKVVNIILRRRFTSKVVNTNGGFATEGQGERFTGNFTYTRIHDNDRLNIAGRVQTAASLLESERNIIPEDHGIIDPTKTITDDTAYRTLSPSTRNYSLNANMARQLSDSVNLSVNIGGSYATSDTLNGLASGTLAIPASNPFSDGQAASLRRYLSDNPLDQDSSTTSLNTGLSLNAELSKRWRLSVIASYEHSDKRTHSDRGYDTGMLQDALDADDPDTNPYGQLQPALLGDMRQDRARALSDSGSASVLANGKLFKLPAGDIGVSIKAGGDFNSLRSTSTIDGLTNGRTATRSNANGQVSLDLPIAKRTGFLSVLGNLTANINAAVTEVSDYGTLGTFGYGLNWTPRTGISLIASVNQDRSAPTLSQRNDPELITQNVQIYDYVRGETVSVSHLTGGNPDLKADDRKVYKLGVTLTPAKNFSLSANYIKSRTRDAIISIPGISSALEDAYPDRFMRDPNGILLQIDTRPVNIAREDKEQLRWGINFTKVLRAPKRPERPAGSQSPGGQGYSGQSRQGRGDDAAAPPLEGRPEETSREIIVAGRNENEAPGFPPPGGFENPDGFGRPAGERPADGFGPPSGGSGRFGPPGGERRGGFGGGGSDNGARFQFSLYHTWVLRDEVMLKDGDEAIDLLSGGTLGGTAKPRHSIQLNTGVIDNGIGLRLTGNWQSAAKVLNDTASSSRELHFSSLMTFDLRLFANLANRFREEAWAKGTRVSLTVANLFNQRQRVRDANGDTPLAYQAAYLDPEGRRISLSVRRIF
jgi:outer membrane cobalamin receptor